MYTVIDTATKKLKHTDPLKMITRREREREREREKERILYIGFAYSIFVSF